MKVAAAATASGMIGLSVLLAGCTTGNQAANGSSSGTPAASVAPSESPSSTCSLPVAGSRAANGMVALGYIQLPSGTFQADSTTGIVYEPATQRSRTTQAPVLWGDSGAAYDRAAGRWLPVAPAQVLADGSAYVYTREASPSQAVNQIHLVNVATGSDRIIYNQGAYDALAYRPEGVYVVHHLNGTDAANGLWLLNPATGSLKAFTAGQRASWAAVTDGAAWSYSLDGSRFGSAAFARLDLSSGDITTWFSAPSTPQPPEPGSRVVRVIGFDGGQHPIVEVYVLSGASAPEVRLLSGPGQASNVSGLMLGDFTPPPGITDSHGTWVVGSDGVYLYSGTSFQRMAAAPPGWMPNYSVAGSCR